MNRTVKHILTVFAILVATFSTTEALAVTWDFTSGGVFSDFGFGNSATFTADSQSVVVNSWYAPDSEGNFGTGQLRSWSTGLGSCNQGEGLNCGSPSHQVDNYGYNDYVLFYLDGQYEFESVRIDPWGTYDRDVTYWIGTIDPADLDLSGLDYDNLASIGFGSQENDFNSTGSGGITIPLDYAMGNALLFGAYKDETGSDWDKFKIKYLKAEAVIPEPATMALFGTGLAGAFFRHRKANA